MLKHVIMVSESGRETEGRSRTHRRVSVTRDVGGRGPTLATGASGCYRYLDGITGLKTADSTDKT